MKYWESGGVLFLGFFRFCLAFGVCLWGFFCLLVWFGVFFDFKPEDNLGVVLGLCYLCKYQQYFDLKSQRFMFI